MRAGAPRVHFLKTWQAGYYTGREVDVSITYKTNPGEWGLPHDLCVLSVAVLRVPRHE